MLNIRGSIKGNHSIILKGKDTNKVGELLIVNHDEKTVEKFFADITEESIGILRLGFLYIKIML